MNISMLLQMAADTLGDRAAVSCDGEHFSYADLWQRAMRAATLFRDSDCRYVSVLDTSSPAVPIALFGSALAGIPYVPLNYRLTEQELAELIERVEPLYLVADETNTRRFAANRRDPNVVTGRAAFLDATASGTAVDATPPDDPTTVAVQLFTSGTTGKPKAAILRNEHLVSYILSTVDFMSADEGEATLVSVPPYHIAGISALLSSTYSCRRIVQLPAFAPDAWLDLAARERTTNAFVVPTMLARIVDHLETTGTKPELSEMRAIAYGGGRMPLPVIERAMQLFPGIDFTNAYGLTETSSTITLLGPDEHRAAFASDDATARRRLGSVGKPLPSVELQIRRDDNTPLAAGEAGEIFVRGPQVSGEYLERNALTDDGWFPTRDAGFVDDDGYLFLSGRADDVIVRGGENISPAEIEDVLISHPAVADAAVLAIPSEEWGETVGAVIVRREGETVETAELQALVRGRTAFVARARTTALRR